MHMLRCAIPMLLAAMASAQVAITNPSVMARDLTRDRVRDIFLGRVSAWSDGSPIVIILVGDSSVDEALESITGRDHVRLLRGWKRLLFSGNGSMPIVASSVREAQELVAGRPGAIAILAVTPEAQGVVAIPLDGR